MKCTKPKVFEKSGQVPCGACLSCRINKANEWALRLTHEMQSNDSAVFLTLTYDEESIPENKSLKKRDIQLFIKRLRKKISILGRKKIRYFVGGEYGEDKERPHYHAIIFNITEDDKKLIKESWQNGIVDLKPFGFTQARYVAKYTCKQITGEKAKEHYKNRIPEFSLQSRKPAIGMKFAEKNIKGIKDKGYVSYRRIKYAVPRAYKKKLFTEQEIEQRREEAFNQQCEHRNELVKKSLTNSQCPAIMHYDTLRQMDRNLQAKTKKRGAKR